MEDHLYILESIVKIANIFALAISPLIVVWVIWNAIEPIVGLVMILWSLT